MSIQDEIKARRILGLWRGASEAHIRSDLQRASNEARGPKDQRISLSLKANWNYSVETALELSARKWCVHGSMRHAAR
jgi:hypothetical protein